MKIASIRAVQVDLPQFYPRSQPTDVEYESARGSSWVESGPVANPMTRYPRYAAYRPSWTTEWPDIGCVVEAEDGTWGFALANHGRPVGAIIDDYLGPRLVGESALATEKCYDMMVRMGAPYGATGLHAFAVSAIDLALWDLKGKLLDRPVYELLGGPSHDDLECYATGGDTDWHLELGFRATKLPCPYGPADGLDGIRKNVELVARTRELVGPDVEIMLDCWMAFDIEYAVRLVEELRPYKLKWFEEMLPPDQLDAHAEVRRRLPWQTLATGEHWQSTAMFQHAASHHLVDIFQPDLMWVGGMTPLVKICAIAEAAGISVIPHAGGNSPYGQHAGYAMAAIPWTEVFVATPPGVPLDEGPKPPGTATPVAGRMVPSDAPGFGLEISEDMLTPLDG